MFFPLEIIFPFLKKDEAEESDTRWIPAHHPDCIEIRGSMAFPVDHELGILEDLRSFVDLQKFQNPNCRK
jgi:hypothetical protein